MTREETTKLLALANANWYRLPIDDAVIAGWTKILEHVSFADGMDVLMDYIREGHEEPPAPGMIHARVVARHQYMTAAEYERLEQEAYEREQRERLADQRRKAQLS